MTATDKNIRLLNAFTVFSNMSFVIAVIVPYYRDEMGLDFQAFLIGEAFFAATVVLLEVPTGWISDIWQRKHVLLLAALVEMIGYSCLLFGEGLLWAIVAQSVIGVAISLISGTNTSMLYDTLLSSGREREFRQREGKRAGMGFYSISCASIASGFIYAFDHKLTVLMSVLAIFGSLVMAFFMQEPTRHKRAPEKHPIADMIKTARYALHGHAEIGVIILFAATLFCSTKMIMWSQQPYYAAVGIPEAFFGVLMAAGFFLAGMSSQLGHKLDGKVGSIRALATVWIVAILVCLGAAFHVGLSGVGLLMLGGSCLFGLANPRVSEAINQRVDSTRRATILSTQSLMTSLLFIPVSSVIGWVSDHHGITGTLLAIAAWLCCAGLLLVFFFTRKSRRHMLML